MHSRGCGGVRIYGDMPARPNPEYLIQRSILTPQNLDVDDINNYIVDRWQGEEHNFESADRVVSDELNSLTLSDVHRQCPDSMPPHLLKLKERAALSHCCAICTAILAW